MSGSVSRPPTGFHVRTDDVYVLIQMPDNKSFKLSEENPLDKHLDGGIYENGRDI